MPTQKDIYRWQMTIVQTELKMRMNDRDKARLGQQAGQGTSGYMMPPYKGNPKHKMTNNAIKMAICDRLMATPEQVLGGQRRNLCSKCNKCGAGLHDPLQHAVNCLRDGWRTHLHNRIRDELHEWLKPRVKSKTYQEQHVPELNYMEKGQLKLAKMDLVWEEDGKIIWLDVTTTTPMSVNSAIQRTYTTPGRATQRAEENKWRQYWSDKVTVFAVDLGGKLGETATSLIKRYATKDEYGSKSEDIMEITQTISALVQAAKMDSYVESLTSMFGDETERA